MIAPRRAYTLLVAYLMLHLRTDLVALIGGSLALPIATLALIQYSGFIAPDSGVQLLGAGIFIVPALFTALLVLPGIVAAQRHGGQLAMLGTLPIGRFSAVSALLTVLATPVLLSTAVTALFAATALHRSLLLSLPVVLIAIPLTIVTLSSIGLVLGMAHLSRNAVTWLGGAIVLALLFILANDVAPTTPALARAALHLVPTVAASSLISSLSHKLNLLATVADILVLVLYSAGSFALAYRLIPWRNDSRESVQTTPQRIVQMPPTVSIE